MKKYSYIFQLKVADVPNFPNSEAHSNPTGKAITIVICKSAIGIRFKRNLTTQAMIAAMAPKKIRNGYGANHPHNI
jgi:hypothetical protein